MTGVSISGSGKRVTLRDVAREAGVSIKTASRVVNGEAAVNVTTAARVARVVARVVDRLGYRPNERRPRLTGDLLDSGALISRKPSRGRAFPLGSTAGDIRSDYLPRWGYLSRSSSSASRIQPTTFQG